MKNPTPSLFSLDLSFYVNRQGIAYLCGHLHTLGGLVPSMYARPVEGHLELEAGDWKENRRLEYS